MSIGLYSTQELIQVQQRLQNLPDGFWRDRYTRVITSDREEIMFEVADANNRKLAPFVAPNVQGRVMRGQGYSARTFRPAYTKPKHIVDPTQAIPRMMGNATSRLMPLPLASRVIESSERPCSSSIVM